ncbi:hypothetical protein ACLO87_05235 [Paenalcaligenes sp. Me52]|uniref:hypothetical protein n=1 Tax=Paenalcaligenes sp. Me52 TaxID=3392038 RepID=UPI003D2E3D78
MIGLIVAGAIGLYSIYVLIRSGGILFGVADINAEQRKRAWMHCGVAALALLLCVLWYNMYYDSPEAQQERALAVQETRCTDVLEAYKATQILVRDASKSTMTLSFAFVPTHDSKMVRECEFIIQAPADRVIIETGRSDKAVFTANVRYRKDDDAWEMMSLDWQDSGAATE